MKAVKFFVNLALILSLSAIVSLAQTENPPVKTENPETKTEEIKVENTEKKEEVKTETPRENPPMVPTVETPTPTPAPTPTDDEESQILPYYDNYLKEYRLGPNDVISVEVFGQCPDYCVTSKTVPPTARISYPLIREGVLVGGKTVEQVADEITKKLDEYIIDPKVTVTLEKAMSVRYSVMGKVAVPGIRVMDRKVSLYEAIIEAGGIAKDGNKKKIALIRFDRMGRLTRQDVNLAEIETGKSPMIFLEPGDQVFVSGKGFTLDKLLDTVGKFSVVRLLFGAGF
ncbi:MAG TPA: polysaccharide biosynthesis/export family protein [Pyrinomonadaceae bacterium]|nr:polysaccharide biosynthesis/export family protein [Pyrinomonadaceae bacterium]